MEFQHDQSWNSLTAILAAKPGARDAWDKFTDFHEQTTLRPYWSQLRGLDIETEQTEIAEWLQRLITNNQIPGSVAAIWIGIFKLADGDKEIPTIYFSGANTYDEEDIDWACGPIYLPESAYAQLGILQQIDTIAKTDEEKYEFLDWILPLAYCAFTFDEILRTRVDKKLILKNRDEMHVALGYDSGDYVELTPIGY